LFQELPTSFIYAEIGLLVPGCHKEKSLCDDMVGKVKKKKTTKVVKVMTDMVIYHMVP